MVASNNKHLSTNQTESGHPHPGNNTPPKPDHSTGPYDDRDEGWWRSVLADEERLSTISRPRNPANSTSAVQKVEIHTNTVMEIPQADWGFTENVFKQDAIVSLTVIGFNRGGLLAENNKLRGFVPYSHLVEMTNQTDVERDNFLATYVGKELRLKIIECVPEEGRVVFSERAARADAGRRTELFSSLRPGEIAQGEVTNITEFGAFIDLGGVEGLIHISELSWGRVLHPSHILHLGQKVEVQVIDILPDRCRIALSLKRLQANPWENVGARYSANDIVPATITSIVSFGVFARMDDGLEGLVHVSEINMNGATVRDLFSEGQRVKVRILHIDSQHQRLGLSMKLDGYKTNA